MQTKLSSPELIVTLNFFGAEICSIKNKTGTEFIWQADKAVWPRHAPVLFPIVGRLKDNYYNFKNKTYNLSQHGFARDMEFELFSSSASECVFQITDNEATLEKFPFRFVFQIRYSLNGNKLTTAYTVKNTGTEDLFFSMGAHPGFNCPLLTGETFEDYSLVFEKNNFSLSLLSNGLRPGGKKELTLQNNTLPLSHKLFENDALVFENTQIEKITLASHHHRIELECNGWPYFGIWGKKEKAPFVCLEPWYGIADKTDSDCMLEHKQGIISLKAGKEFNCSFSMTFS